MDTNLGRAACVARTQAEEREYTIGGRAARASWDIAHGASFTTAEAAERYDMSRQGAWRMMCGLSNFIPIYQNADGEWQACQLREIDDILT